MDLNWTLTPILVLLFIQLSNVGLTVGTSLVQLMEAEDGAGAVQLEKLSDAERDQCLAQITPEQEEKIENAVIEDVKRTVGTVHVEEEELKEPRGVAKMCKQLSQKFDCEKAKRSKETCVEVKALLERMAGELSSASPEEMEGKANSYVAVLKQIWNQIDDNKKSAISRRVRRGFGKNLREWVVDTWWPEMKELWRECWLKKMVKKLGKIAKKEWGKGKYGTFIVKLIGALLGTVVVGVAELPTKIVVTVVALVCAVLFAITD